MAGSYDYFQMLQAVENYYGAGSDQWATMMNWTGYRSTEIASILKQTPGVNTVVNEAGELVGWSLGADAVTASAEEAAAAQVAAAINSNAASVASSSASLSVPGNVLVETAPQTISITSGATKVATGSKAATVLGHVGTWLVGAGVGMKLGVWIDSGLYDIYQHNPDWDIWNPEYMEYLNPELWKQHKITNWLYDYSGYDDFSALFNGDDEQLYIDENLFALTAQYLASQGFFTTDFNPYATIEDKSVLKHPDNIVLPVHFAFLTEGSCGNGTNFTIDSPTSSPVACIRLHVKVGNSWSKQFFTCSEENYSVTEGGVTRYPSQYTTNGKTYWCLEYSNNWQDTNTNVPGSDYIYPGVSDWLSDVAYVIFEGEIFEPTVVPGVNQYDNVPTGITDQMTPQDIIQLLKQQFPELWDDAIKQGTLNNDGTVTDRVYIPIALPSGGEEGEPTTDPEHPGQVDPNNETQTKTVTKVITPTPNPTTPEPDIGGGDTPVPVLPTGAADALYSIYNPTLAEVRSFGAWLWSPNFVDQLLKVFSDPMQAIISLHKIYFTPHTDSPQPIKVGYLTSNVSAKVVDEQYVEVNCGSVNLLEKSGNVFDYSPFTDVRLYLPFIGIVRLDVADIMRSTISVKYRCDVITGTIIAFVNVSRDSAGGTIYQFTGSCAEHFPLSSGSYMGIVGGLLTMAAGITTAVASGGATIPLAGAAVAHGVANAHTNVECSNGFTANAGAMGIKKPYLIVSKQQAAMANNVSHMIGMPANYFVKISSCSGRIKVKAVYVDSIANATDKEKNMIESSLKSGIII